MSAQICDNCGHNNEIDAKYCDNCGVELSINKSIDLSKGDNFSEENSEAEAENPPVMAKVMEKTNIQENLNMIDNTDDNVNKQTEDKQTEDNVEQEKETTTTKTTPVLGPTILDEVKEKPKTTSNPTVVEFSLPQGFLVHKETEKKWELSADKTTFYIGRPNEEREIDIDLSTFPEAEIVSRLHAMIIIEEENYYLEDAGSQNGTSLNGEIIKVGSRYRKQLNDGDTITFGKKRTINLTFEKT